MKWEYYLANERMAFINEVLRLGVPISTSHYGLECLYLWVMAVSMSDACINESRFYQWVVPISSCTNASYSVVLSMSDAYIKASLWLYPLPSPNASYSVWLMKDEINPYEWSDYTLLLIHNIITACCLGARYARIPTCVAWGVRYARIPLSSHSYTIFPSRP